MSYSYCLLCMLNQSIITNIDITPRQFTYISSFQFIPTLYLNILCFIKVNKVDDNYTHLSAIGLVCSLLGEIFWTFENEVFLTVGMLEYIISHLFIASAAVLNICSEKSIYKRSFSQNMYLGIISTLLWIISYLVASCYVIELILINFFSIKDSLLH